MHSGNINNLFTLLFFLEALSTLLFSGKISLDKICTEKIVSKSFKFIKKYALKLLLENNKNFFFLPSFISAQRGPRRAENRLGPAVLARTGRAQAATWAWAGKVPRALAPAWAGNGPWIHGRWF